MIPKIGMLLHGLFMYLSVLCTVRRIQKSYPFDVIDAHYVYPDGFAGVLLARHFRKPLVVSARGSDINLFSTFPIVRRLLIYVLSRASHLITVSAALRAAIIDLGIPQSKISVIPNGVDGGKFKKIEKATARRMTNLPQQSPMLLSVGGLTETKRFDRLIAALRIILDESDDEKPFLVVVGEGRSRKKLEALISKLNLDSHIRLVGAVAHEQLYLWYSAADVFCLASEREGWPNVILEALSCGLPVVGTDVGGIPEIISTEDIGFLTQRDSAIMATQIRKAMQKKWDSDDITRYAQSYTWETVASRLRLVFETVLKNSELQNVSSKVGLTDA
jgi:teichuronic acid biosynthesis glycosyltransferase TuaC